MPRGGKRQGTPGHTYSNRTDMMTDYAPGGTPALGNAAPNPSAPTPAPQSAYPEDTPMLLDPSNRPNEPVTAGLGQQTDPNTEAWATLKAELPSLKMVQQTWQDVSPTFNTLVSYLENR